MSSDLEELFRKALEIAIANRITTAPSLAIVFQTPWSIIDKWVEGSASPVPSLKRQVLSYLETRIEEEQSSSWDRLKKIGDARGAVLDYKEKLYLA